ncbi:MAG: hypothetical protein J7K59_01875 [Candidatus Korarchaeota archaeon]|nr:hypothetical protein [Candidatus Korarchaeota archaeon]
MIENLMLFDSSGILIYSWPEEKEEHLLMANFFSALIAFAQKEINKTIELIGFDGVYYHFRKFGDHFLMIKFSDRLEEPFVVEVSNKICKKLNHSIADKDSIRDVFLEILAESSVLELYNEAQLAIENEEIIAMHVFYTGSKEVKPLINLGYGNFSPLDLLELIEKFDNIYKYLLEQDTVINRFGIVAMNGVGFSFYRTKNLIIILEIKLDLNQKNLSCLNFKSSSDFILENFPQKISLNDFTKFYTIILMLSMNMLDFLPTLIFFESKGSFFFITPYKDKVKVQEYLKKDHRNFLYIIRDHLKNHLH